MAARVNTTTTTVDETTVAEFLGRFVADLGATISAPLVVIGDRLGLCTRGSLPAGHRPPQRSRTARAAPSVRSANDCATRPPAATRFRRAAKTPFNRVFEVRP